MPVTTGNPVQADPLWRLRRPVASQVSPPAPPSGTFPAPPLFPAGYTGAMAELNLSGTWTDITPYVFRTPLTITRGHPDESTTTTPSQCTGTLTNETGIFTGRNPLSAFYGSLMRNTPMRVSVPEGQSYLRLETDTASYASCPDSAALQITAGTLSVRFDGKITDWSNTVNGNSHVLVAKWGLTAQAWGFWADSDGTLAFWHYDGSGGAHESKSSLPVPYYSGRIALRADYNISAQTITFYTAPVMAGPWTQLGTVQATPATTQASGAGQAVTVGNGTATVAGFTQLPGMYGSVYEAQVLQSGVPMADPQFYAQTGGASSFTDPQGNTWTMSGTAALSNRKYLFHGEMAALPQQWTDTFRQDWCDFTAGGVLRRLAQGTNPVNSPLYRFWVRQTGTSYPVDYWSCEDPVGSASFASAVGNQPMTFGPTTELASNSSFTCSAAIPVLTGAAWTGVVTQNPATVWSANAVHMLAQVPAAGDSSGDVLLRAYTTGTVRRLDLIYFSTGNLTLSGFDLNGNQLFTSGQVTAGVNGEALVYSMTLTPSGGNLTWAMSTYAPAAANAFVSTGTLTSASIGAVTQVSVNPGCGLLTTAAGHVAVHSVSTVPATIFSALNAWNGETAGARFTRLCGEEGINCRVLGQPDNSALMGNQTLETLPTLLQECADTDRGIIFEPRQVQSALGYRCLNSLYSQPPAVSWDFSQDQMDMPTSPPIEDDQRTVNDVTVTNTDGSSSHKVISTGLMNVNAPNSVFGAIGRYAQQITVNAQSDSQLPSICGWILHTGSVDEPRYPSIRADLANYDLPSALFYAILDAELGDLTQGANPQLLPWLPPLTGTVRQLIQGSTLVLFVKTLTVDWACVPASPYDVGIVGDPVYGRPDTDGSTLTTGITSTATSMSVTTATGYPVWTTAASDFPFDVQVNYGEIMTVTNITGSTSPQTFTVTRGTNGVAVAHNAGEDIRLAHPFIISL